MVIRPLDGPTQFARTPVADLGDLEEAVQLWLHVQFLHAIILDSGLEAIAFNQYFSTRLICLQFLQGAAILACTNCTCNYSLRLLMATVHSQPMCTLIYSFLPISNRLAEI